MISWLELDRGYARRDHMVCGVEMVERRGSGEDVVGAERRDVLVDSAAIGARKVLAEQCAGRGVVVSKLLLSDLHGICTEASD